MCVVCCLWCVCGVCVCGVCVCPNFKFWTILSASEEVVTELIPSWKSQNLTFQFPTVSITNKVDARNIEFGVALGVLI